ncbi:helix-turn-helix transcriptional regulator [Leucobacter ruminantium]|uniref:Helix-turn-helix transcriptional regulator n=1 Tax=Leucobacter ruminantium TaxID=1289170 RepID=A0A939RUF6_9MICO|nr:helix-turn-helix transcriptional regulator [Leucobacter ruminantium]MBO1805700.1 helix-turn-helix transcriptional regulator [Leucobacter ruminantium]
MTTDRRDRLRELLDAVLDENHRDLEDMAGGAHASRFHFARSISRAAGESPVAMRRRVMLERAAWQLRGGASVTEAAWGAGYDSAEGFSRAFARAFGHPPSTPASNHWLPSPNGIHFHPPTSLWVRAEEHSMNPLTEQLVRHDLDDTAVLLAAATELDADALARPHLPGNIVLEWDGEEASLGAVLEALVHAKEVWLAAIEGLDLPQRSEHPGVGELRERHERVAGRWLAAVRDIEQRGGWNDRLVDALCDPPESFVLGSVVAHVLTFAAHRRQVARLMLRREGIRVDDGDPIMWLRRLRGEAERDEGSAPEREGDPRRRAAAEAADADPSELRSPADAYTDQAHEGARP